MRTCVHRTHSRRPVPRAAGTAPSPWSTARARLANTGRGVKKRDGTQDARHKYGTGSSNVMSTVRKMGPMPLSARVMRHNGVGPTWYAHPPQHAPRLPGGYTRNSNGKHVLHPAPAHDSPLAAPVRARHFGSLPVVARASAEGGGERHQLHSRRPEAPAGEVAPGWRGRSGPAQACPRSPRPSQGPKGPKGTLSTLWRTRRDWRPGFIG